MSQKKLAISMRGGGARTTAYLGVLKALEEEDIKVDMIIGSSAGAAVGVSYALGIPIERIINFTSQIHHQRLVGLDSLHDVALWSDQKFESMVEELVGDLKIEDSRFPVYVQLTNIDTMEMEIFSSGSAKKLITATMSFPFLMNPSTIGGKCYMDGDFTSSFATEFLKNRGAEFVFGLVAGRRKVDFRINHFELGERFLEPMNIALYQINKLNSLIDKPDYVIKDLGKDVEPLDFSRNMELVDYGYKTMKQNIAELRTLLEKRFLGIF